MSSSHELAPIGKHQYVGDFMVEYQGKSNELRGRKFKFLEVDLNASTQLARGGAIGLAAGVGTGMIVGGVVGGLCGSPGGPPGVILGVSIGVPLGAFIGTAIGVGVAASQMEPRFERWCESQSGLEFMRQLAPFIMDEERLQQYICPITNMALIDAVRAPNGTLYEKYAILEWVQRNGTDPLTRQRLEEKDLVPDRSISFESNKIFLDALREKIPLIREKAPELLENINCMIKDIRESAMDQYNGKLLILQNQYREEKITYETFKLLSQQLADKYFNI